MKIMKAKTSCQLGIVEVTPAGCAICVCGREFLTYSELALHLDREAIARFHHEYRKSKKPLQS